MKSSFFFYFFSFVVLSSFHLFSPLFSLFLFFLLSFFLQLSPFSLLSLLSLSYLTPFCTSSYLYSLRLTCLRLSSFQHRHLLPLLSATIRDTEPSKAETNLVSPTIKVCVRVCACVCYVCVRVCEIRSRQRCTQSWPVP